MQCVTGRTRRVLDSRREPGKGIMSLLVMDLGTYRCDVTVKCFLLCCSCACTCISAGNWLIVKSIISMHSN